jgi:uncharacterized protein YcbK (DUF882 family)
VTAIPDVRPPTLSRRGLLRLGGVAGCALGLGMLVKRRVEEKRLVLRNPETRAELDVVYRRDRALVGPAIAQIDAFLCDPSGRGQHPTDPDLLDELHALSYALGVAPVFELVSGYRAQRGEESRPSLHALGRAIDLRLAGVDCADLASAALKIARGGVGYYRKPNFVHLDTGAQRSWRG